MRARTAPPLQTDLALHTIRRKMRSRGDTSGQYRPLTRRCTEQAAQKNVLVVEDNPDVQWRLARILTVAGFRVVGASSSDGANALVAHARVDAALLNTRLFDQEREYLTADGRKLPVVWMTNHDKGDPETRTPTAKGDVSLVLRAPFRPGQVRDAIEAVLRKAASEEAQIRPSQPLQPWLLPLAPVG